MRIEMLSQWTLRSGLADQSKSWKSIWMTGALCAVIVASLLAVIYVKYENHRLYSEIKKLETRTHAVYRDHQVISSQHMRNINYDAVQGYITQQKMVVSY